MHVSYGRGFMFDWTYLLVILGVLICSVASAMVNSAMRKYAKVAVLSGKTGAEAARQILNNEGLYHVQIECLPGNDGDHFDPSTNTVRLSRQNYSSASVTAIGVAAHECGHAIQHAEGYTPISIRTALVPVVNLGSKLGLPIILIGVFLSWNMVLIRIGIFAFALSSSLCASAIFSSNSFCEDSILSFASLNCFSAFVFSSLYFVFESSSSFFAF